MGLISLRILASHLPIIISIINKKIEEEVYLRLLVNFVLVLLVKTSESDSQARYE